jgi:predicted peptidase
MTLPWVSICILGLCVACAPAAHGTRATGFFERSVRLDGVDYRFSVWVPPGERSGEQPAILFLHGASESGDDGRVQTQVGLGRALRAHPRAWPFVVVFPQKPNAESEWEEHETMVFVVLDRAIREFGIDRSRVALAGMSQGGHGAWTFGARHPERWTCLVPVCGYGRARTVSPRVARLPVWAFHGLKDDVVDPAETRHIIEGIRAERQRLRLDPAEARVTYFPNANHNSWDSAFAEPALPGWIAAHTLPR